MEERKIELEVIHKEPEEYQVNILIHVQFILSALKAVEVIRQFFRIFQEIFLECTGRFFTRLDDILVLGEGKKGKHNNAGAKGRQIRRFYEERLKTPWGEVRYRCREVKEDGKHSIPLRGLMGLGKKKQVVEELFGDSLDMCLITSFEKAWKTCKNAVSLGKLWGMFQESGQRVRRELEEGARYYRAGDSDMPPEGDTACVMADEIWIRGKRTPEERKKARKQEEKTGKKKRKWLKVKTALVRTKQSGESGWGREAVYASCCGAMAFLHRAGDYFNSILGLDRIAHKFCITDGDSFGKKLSAHIEALWLLDWWHIWEHLKVLRVFGKDIRKEVWELLKVERVDEVFALLRAFLEEIKTHLDARAKDEAGKDPDAFTYMKHIKKSEKSWWEKRLKDVEQLITYLSNQRKGIEDYRKLLEFLPAEDILFGNGPVERKQGTMIGYRMKGQGKTWCENGAENMIARQFALCNGQDAENRIAYLRAQAQEWEIADNIPAPSDIEGTVKKTQKWRTAGFPAHQNGKRNSFPYRVSQNVLNGGFILTKT